MPLVRNTKVFAAPGAPIELPIEAIESQKQDDLDKKAAKLAAEMDGYKRVTIVGRTGSGACVQRPTEARLRSYLLWTERAGCLRVRPSSHSCRMCLPIKQR